MLVGGSPVLVFWTESSSGLDMSPCGGILRALDASRRKND